MNRAGGMPGLFLGPETSKPNTWKAAQPVPWFWLPSPSASTQNIYLDGNLPKQAIVLNQATPNFSAVPNLVEGATYELLIVQDSTGSRVPSFTTSGVGSFDFGTDGAPTLTTTASKGDLLAFEAFRLTPGATLRMRYIGIKKGYS